jgi:hypothetical protein
MSDEPQAVIAAFEDQAVAEAVRAALHDAGIEASLLGDAGRDAHPDWVAGHVHAAPIQVVVPASRLEDAAKVLEEIAAAKPHEGWEADAEGAIDGWICHNCDTVMSKDEPACTACGALRSEQPQQDEGDEGEEGE